MGNMTGRTTAEDAIHQQSPSTVQRGKSPKSRVAVERSSRTATQVAIGDLVHSAGSRGHSWFHCTFESLLGRSADEIAGALSLKQLVDRRFRDQRPEQADAWREQVQILQQCATALFQKLPSTRNWTVLLEYEIPRRQRRIDAVILANHCIFAVEFKVGACTFTRGARWQAEDYALDLRDFHGESHDRDVTPILVATDASGVENRDGVLCCGRNELADVLVNAYCLRVQADPEASPIDAERWDEAEYRPSLHIVEAANEVFVGHSVREMSHAYADNLTLTVDALGSAVDRARSEQRRVVCFVTGVPGSGKTLVGLTAVHGGGIHVEDGRSAFMSGNGPLVKVLRTALRRDRAHTREAGRAIGRSVELLVQNVHGFTEEYGLRLRDSVPRERVLVFDEAQRAWSADKLQSWNARNRRGQQSAQSEAGLILDIMGRWTDWCVVVALVGGGQEIHTGEAGLESWGRALVESPYPWDVIASPEVLHGGASVADHRLFTDDIPARIRVLPCEALHLSVTVRSPRAQQLTEWVNAVLDLDSRRARDALTDFSGFRIGLTRHLHEARAWLRDATHGDLRPGLLASSGALRLRAHGLELSTDFRRAFPVDDWFLDPPGDLRSSHMLEVAMTEFESQGLELDYTGLCWGDDLTVGVDGRWEMRKLNSSKWQRVSNPSARQYLLNKYRVLLTRAREGMIMWVPQGDKCDPTRDPERLDRTAAYLQQTGLPLID